MKINDENEQMPTALQFAYWAGVLDCFPNAVRSVSSRTLKHPLPRVRLRSLDRAMMERVAKDLGGTLFPEHREGRRTQWVWQRVGTRAKFIVNGMAAYFIRHQEEAQKILRWHPQARRGPGRGWTRERLASGTRVAVETKES